MPTKSQLEKLLQNHVKTEYDIYYSHPKSKALRIGLSGHVATKPMNGQIISDPMAKALTSEEGQGYFKENDLDTAKTILKMIGQDPNLATDSNSRKIIDVTTKILQKKGWIHSLIVGPSVLIPTLSALVLTENFSPIVKAITVGLAGILGITVGILGSNKFEKKRSKWVNKDIEQNLSNRIMEKIATKYGKEFSFNTDKAKEDVKNRDYEQNLNMGMLAGTLGAIPLNAAANKWLYHHLEQENQYSTPSKDFFEKVKKARPHLKDLKFRSNDFHKSTGPHYSFDPIKAVLDRGAPLEHHVEMAGYKNLGVLAHELGHADDLAKHRGITAGRSLLNILGQSPLGRAIIPGLMVTNEKTRDYAVPAYMASYAPQLFDEGRANYKGYKLLKELDGKASANKFLRTVVPSNTASYWSVPLAVGGGMYAFKRYLDKKYEKKKKHV